MAIVMETLSRLPKDIQEKILEEISLSPDLASTVDDDFTDDVTIEINDHSYVIPFEVFKLIDNLSEQIRELISDYEVPNNQRF
tara:strand:- start:5800 stop:6048 length:249 start_codon:yes stop_codon:yes gene_type:complete